MAERQPEEEEKQFRCKFCPNAYKSAKALKAHMREKHADNPLLEEAIKSAPKDTCPFCREPFGNVVKHRRHCKSNPEVPTRVTPLPAHLLDDDMVITLRHVFFESPLLNQTMGAFSSGQHLHAGCKDQECMDSRCMLGIRTMQGVQNFLALAIFLSDFGLRLEVVKDVTLGGLQEGAMELNLSGGVLKIVRDFTWVLRPTNDPKFQPFERASWTSMRKLLGGIIKRADQRLWDAANRPKELGSHEFERLAMDEFDALAGPNQGASYEFAMTESQQLALQLPENLVDGGGEEDGGGNASSTSEDLLAGYNPGNDGASSDFESTSLGNPNPPPVPAPRPKRVTTDLKPMEAGLSGGGGGGGKIPPPVPAPSPKRVTTDSKPMEAGLSGGGGGGKIPPPVPAPRPKRVTTDSKPTEAGPSTFGGGGSNPPPVPASMPKVQVQKAVSSSGSDSESSIDEEEREARAMQDELDRDLASGQFIIDLGNGQTQVLQPGLRVLTSLSGDDAEFFRKFKEYLRPRGRPEGATEECISLISDFSRYQKDKNGGAFSLVRLSFLWHLPSREDLLLLPLPWNWLAEFQEKKTRDAAHCAYNDLLDYLEHLLVRHRGKYISSEESLLRHQYLQDIEREVLRTHPHKTFARE